jgi:alkanesulfonate monooxygenase SsuD/methylene tetrahydromethanopterin reductase-like flavin-dependent oxidoreductase (luciferase family)
MIAEAEAAELAGFDGVGVSEHHLGLAGYLPVPVLATSLVASSLRHAWAVACPILLPLRPSAIVVEEIAWLAAAYPGRIGAGFAPGWRREDFESFGADFESRSSVFKEQLRYVARHLAGKGDPQLMADAAVARCASDPVPMVSAAGGPVAARRAAEAGVGVIYSAFAGSSKLHELTEVYLAAGGVGPRILIRKLWVGSDAPLGALQSQFDSYTTGPATPAYIESTEGYVSGEPEEVVHRLYEAARSTGATAFNLRLHLPGISHEQIRQQIELIGSKVLPELRTALAGV